MAKLIYASNCPSTVTRGRTRRLRLGCAGRRRIRVHRRPLAVRGHVPLRTAPVRHDGRMGNRRRPGRTVGPHERLRERLESGGQGRLLHDPGRSVNRQHPARTPLRPRRGTRPEGHGHPRSHRGRSESRHRLSMPGWSTSATCSSGPSSSEGASRHCRPIIAPSSTLRRAPIQQRRRAAPLPPSVSLTRPLRRDARASGHSATDRWTNAASIGRTRTDLTSTTACTTEWPKRHRRVPGTASRRFGARSGPPAPSRRPRGHRQCALRGLAYDAGAEAAVAEVGAPCRLG